MTYVIAQPCVDLKDRACVDECPVDCIYEGKRMLYIHPDECVDCGACEPVCPVEAIFYEDDTPEQWKDYYNANVDFFDDLGSPGGAAKLGVIDKDHPLIAALPPAEPGVTTSERRRRAAHQCPGGRRVLFPLRAAGLPVGPPDAVRRRGPAPTPTASSTSRSARRSTPRPRWCRRRCAAPPTRPGYPTDRRPRRHPAGRASTGWRAASASPGSALDARAAGDRLQGADRLAADPPRPRAGRPRRLPGAGLPDLRGRRPAGRRPRASPPTR